MNNSDSMNNNLPSPPDGFPSLRIFGVGDAGISVVNLLLSDGLSPDSCVVLNTGAAAIETSPATHKLRLETTRLRGLGSGGDPERGRLAAEEKADELKNLCLGVNVVFIIAGLGGGSGTGISPVIARIAKAAGSLVLAFVTLPFDCEGNRRQCLADQGLEDLRDAADGVICLPNQKIFKLIDENTTVVETFKITNRLLADGVHGFLRLLTFKGLIDVHLDEICQLLQDRHSECAFAVAEAVGPGRSSQVIDKLLAHPMLENGEVLPGAEAVLVSITGGPDLTMAEVNRVMDQIKGKCESAQVMMGACVDERVGDRLAVTVITANHFDQPPQPRGPTEELDTQLLDRNRTAKPGSRFLPPPPTLPPEQIKRILSSQARTRSGPRRTLPRMRQGQLPLEIVSKGRFDKSEPTIHKGEDLDVPTYLRRGVPLN